jgi:DNA helicase HerA-like ATPase
MPIAISETQYHALKAQYELLATDICVLGPSGRTDAGHVPLRIRFGDLTPIQRPAVLRLDPLRDREEFHSLETLLEGLHAPYSINDVTDAASRYFFEESRNVGLRIANLGIRNWSVWARSTDRSVTDILSEKRRCTVIDVGALEKEDERDMISMVVLDHFWAHRSEREPVLLVVDEAHYVAPASPNGELQRVCTELAVRIAGEGVKYGIYLVVASQRPGKLNMKMISQCENQIIMKMTSRADLGVIG